MTTFETPPPPPVAHHHRVRRDPESRHRASELVALLHIRRDG